MDVRLVKVDAAGNVLLVLQEYDNLPNGVVSASLFATPNPGNAIYEIQVRMRSGVSSGGALCLNRALTAQALNR